MRLRSGVTLLALGMALAPGVAAAQESDGLEKKAAEWLALLKTERFDSAAARVSPVARSSMSSEQLAMIWPQIVDHFGTLDKTSPINRLEQNGYVVIQLLGTFSKGPQTIRVAFDKDGLVAGFFVVGPPGDTRPAPRPGVRRAPRPGR